jgi:hypothetical protein
MDANTKDVLMIAVPLLGTLVTSIISAWVGVRMAVIAQKVEGVGKDVARVEHATNSMKDALVAATAVSAHAQGKAEEKQEEAARQSERAKGEATQVRRQADIDAPGKAP